MVAGTARTTERELAGLVRRCYAGLGADALRTEIAAGLRRLLAIDAAFVATVDPATMLMTGVTTEDPLGADALRFLDNELRASDVNTFTSLAAAADHVQSLDRATGGDRWASARYAEIMAPLGLGDELRAALVTGPHCWGVVCLHREDGPTGFAERELGLLRRLVPHLGEGLRRAVARELGAAVGPAEFGPGILVLSVEFDVVSATPAAQAWLAELSPDSWSVSTGLPVPVHSALAALRSAADGRTVPARVHVRTASGRWLSVHADRLDGPTGSSQIAVLLEPAAPDELGSLFLRAHGLTPAQERVAAMVLRGLTTRQIAAELFISANTVQEHLTGVFDKVGVRSRRELAATLLGAGRAHGAASPHPVR
ncbi:MAG TPA: helix-turn-helix transcriptional regulator [Sporichthya sp.]|nr:helix-turn-helix transcriptional regulator [Sporichthya sp.]